MALAKPNPLYRTAAAADAVHSIRCASGCASAPYPLRIRPAAAPLPIRLYPPRIRSVPRMQCRLRPGAQGLRTPPGIALRSPLSQNTFFSFSDGVFGRSQASDTYSFMLPLFIWGILAIAAFGVTYSEFHASVAPTKSMNAAALASALCTRVQMCGPYAPRACL